MSESFKIIDVDEKSYNRTLMVTVLLIETFVTVLNQTILATAFPILMNTFHISTATVQWLTTGFLLVNGIMIPITAWLSNRIPTKVLYIGSMIIFLIGSIIAAAGNFSGLLIGRLIQAIGVGVTMPLLQTIILTIFAPESRGFTIGLNGCCRIRPGDRTDAFRLLAVQLFLAHTL